MMKRFLTGIIAILMLVQLAVPAVAEGEYSLGCFQFDVPTSWRLDSHEDNKYVFETDAGSMDIRWMDLSRMGIDQELIDMLGQDFVDRATAASFAESLAEEPSIQDVETLVSPRSIQGLSYWQDFVITKVYCVYLFYGADMLLISSASGSRQSMISEADMLLERIVTRRAGQAEYVLGSFTVPCPAGWTLYDQAEGKELVFELEEGRVTVGLTYDDELAGIAPEDYKKYAKDFAKVITDKTIDDVETGTTSQGLHVIGVHVRGDNSVDIAILPRGKQLLYVIANQDTISRASKELLDAIYIG